MGGPKVRIRLLDPCAGELVTSSGESRANLNCASREDTGQVAEGLRVVDASAFPRIPGFFIISAPYMIAEKAADVILSS